MKKHFLTWGIALIGLAASAASCTWSTVDKVAKDFSGGYTWDPASVGRISFNLSDDMGWAASTVHWASESTYYLTSISMAKRIFGSNSTFTRLEIRDSDGKKVAAATQIGDGQIITLMANYDEDNRQRYTAESYEILFSGADALNVAETYSLYAFNDEAEVSIGTSVVNGTSPEKWVPAMTITVSDTSTSPIPEPTSGLLFLLGLGGLALRRRRA